VRGINSQIPLHSVLYYVFYITALASMRIVCVSFENYDFWQNRVFSA
jgi:hypothetical protein